MASDIAPAIRTAPRPKLSARVAGALRTRLLQGDIAPGGQLPTETSLTQEYGVSRTVIREALAALAADGLVEARQGAGVFARASVSGTLSAMSLDAEGRISVALNVLEVRMGIEIESAGFAAERCSHSQYASIREAYMNFDRMLEADQPTNEADFAIHRAIATATNNPFYVEVLDALGPRTIPCNNNTPWGTELVLSPDYQRGLQMEHDVIIEAISRSDGSAARDAMRAHLSRSQERYRARLYAGLPAPERKEHSDA